MVLAAKKLSVTGPQMFPLKYTVTSQNVMMQGTVLAGQVRVHARVDQDGDAISKQPGDVAGKAPSAKAVGDMKVDLILDSLL